MKTVSLSNCCEQKSEISFYRTRFFSPTLAIQHPNAFYAPMRALDNSANAVAFKCAMQRNGGTRNYDVKVGTITSDSGILQGLQSAGSIITPGNASVARNPARSVGWQAVTPNGIPRHPTPHFFSGKPTRGFRCPEGFQFGGRFTDATYSTCGKQLFDFPHIIGQAIGNALRNAGGRGGNGTPGGELVKPLNISGEVIQSRAPQIPKVSAFNRNANLSATKTILEAMSGIDVPTTRMIRRDGFVLEPVVSAGVLRTIPDNRDMEGATYVTTAFDAKNIGVEELGLLSNTGINKISYVLKGGGTLNIEKARPLTVGERRKLGKTVNVAAEINNSRDPAARLRYVASEMEDAIRYSENFPNIDDPNEVIEVKLPGSNTKTRIRRWHYESFYLKNPKNRHVEGRAESSNTPTPVEKIDDLSGAVRHLNNNGSIEFVAPGIRAEALKRSKLYKTGKIKNGVTLHERADGQTIFEIAPTHQYDHIGASVSSELQRYMGLIAPKVRVTGTGARRSYLISEAQDAIQSGSQNRIIDATQIPAGEVLGIAMSDWLLDTYKRNPSTIAPVNVRGKMHAIASINPMAGLAEGTASSNRARIRREMQDFFEDDLRNMYRQHFEKLKLEQRKQAVLMFDKLISRAKEFDFEEMRQRLVIDGALSGSDKVHLQIVGSMFKNRLDMLSSSRATFLKILGLGK
jgi:hypothetical protein